MGVTIDSIELEIQSDSTNASKGIDDFIKSLETLKKAGKLTTVTKNLNSLSSAIKGFSNASKASSALGTLATAIEKLRSAGSIASQAKNLDKLQASLRSLEAINMGSVGPKIKELADALSPLSQVKAGGFTSLVKSLGQIGAVTKSLDDKTITEFAAKVDLLTQKLGPLADKMATVKTGFAAINTQARKAADGMEEAGDKINASALNLSSFIEIARTAVETLTNLIQRFTDLIAEAIEWDGIAARFGRGFGDQAQETYEWIQRLNKEMGINIQQFMKYSSIYSTMLTGFGVANEDAAKMALGYTELTYDIWAGYNDIYKSFDEASEAVRSAIAGEVEPIRRAGFTIVESQLEQTAAAHGLEISLYNATEAQKSYLRYLTLVDQAHSQNLIGTYAKELNTAEGLTRTLAQQMNSLSQAFGSLFLPILVRVLPYVQAFVELLTEAVYWLAGLFGIEIQPVDWSSSAGSLDSVTDSANDATGALDDATKAAKELKNATLGIDELNVISPSSAAGAGAGGAGSGAGGASGFEGIDIDSLWDESIFKQIDSQIDDLKEELESWLPLIAAIGTGLSAWGLLSLITSAGEAMVKLSELEGKIGTLKKALAGLAILTIEAFLVFKLSDEYLESGNLMALFGEALVTAAGGFLMYKGFGPKGLVLSLAVSVAAQLAAITLNLADGGVDIGDPELWIQSAFTAALGGVTGGILAYKGLIPVSKGKGVGLGLLAGLSLTLAAITIGEVTENGELTKGSILTGLGSVFAAAGFGFTIGGPWGALIGAAVGLAINIVGASIGAVSANAKKSLEEDMASRFGKITLDSESLEVYVEKITAIPREVTIGENNFSVTAALEVYVSEAKILGNFEENVYNALEKLDAMNVKIAVGVEVEYNEYVSQIEMFISGAQEYLEQHYLTTSIAINMIENDSTNDLSSSLSSFYAKNSGKLAELGSALKNAVSDSFVDGEWIPDKLQEAVELQQEIQEILDYVSNVEYRATMENLKISVSGDMLTKESFTSVLEGAKEAIEARLDSLEEVKMSQLQVAIMQYDANIEEGMSEAEAKKIYDETVADIEEAYQNGRIEVNFGTVDFGLETLRDAFAAEIELAKNEKWFDYKTSVADIIEFGMYSDVIDKGNGEIYSGLKMLMSDLEAAYAYDASKLSKEARKNLESLLEALKPTMADYEELAAASRKAGKSVPENVRIGLNDYNEIAALSGDTDAINYLIGQGFSTDTTFLNTLATVKKAGKQIDESVAEGLLNNISYVTDEATGVVTGIKNSVTGEVIAITPTLVDNMEYLGVDLSDGLLKGAESGMESKKKKWFEWAIWPWNWFKKENEINSPSKLFERGGNYLAQGLTNGFNLSAFTKKFKDGWESVKTWWNEKKSSLKSYTPSIGSIKDKLSSAWTTAKNWWSKSKAKLSTYTPSIGSIYENLYDRWKNARDWWNKKKGSMSYTPTIGSIVDKLKSAWNTAKTWWNKNVKLSIPSMSFKVTYSTPSSKTMKAIMKALDLPGWPKLSFAANGGMFDQGSLVWAGERGPEVVANAGGGKTGVMNVQQMADAMYEAVYAATIAANRASGSQGGGVTKLYIDGREVTSVVEKRQNERGASIMGNEVYSY